MSHVVAFLLGIIMSTVFFGFKNSQIKNDVSLTCPEIDFKPVLSNEVAEAFKACLKSLDERTDKLSYCQDSLSKCEIKQLETKSCETLERYRETDY